MTNKDNFQLTLTPADKAAPAFLVLVEEAEVEEAELALEVVLTADSEAVEVTADLVYVEVTEEAATLPVETKLVAVVCWETEEEEAIVVIIYLVVCVYGVLPWMFHYSNYEIETLTNWVWP